ncbi:hypothetical protein L9F63_009132 [Diploptera punctata]|uniref:RZ-type domain-containing protein n=1 Tax=Diploptera punctata TaxID=6984 RepID=A0AAD7Z423_DIPPU|nr:hypothetical protein L9F63_009132 [Diploptera punctata]
MCCRFRYITQLFMLESMENFQHIKNNNPTVEKTHKQVSELIYSPLRFSQHKQVSELLKKLAHSSKSALEIFEKERKQIVQALGLKSGHWFKCPKGHIYLITECGGAMQTGRCNECGSQIGGTNHRLLSDNSFAPEMDGARYPAYSEAANLANFDQNEFLN